MADNILKLRVESSEYDQKLKKAAEGIRHLADVAHKSGGDLTGLEKAELDYVKALGSMETKSRTAAGGVRELESTFKELTVVYNNLNDVEKQDEGGKALRASLDQIKQRAQAARAELDAASKSLQGAENSMKGGGFGGMMGKMSGMLGVSPVMLTGIGAATAAFAGLKAVIGDNISTAKGFEKSMSQLSSLTGMTGKDLDKLKEYAIDLGSTSTLTASQVADAFRLIGSQQPQLLSSGEALKEVTKYAITLSEAAGIDLHTAAQTLSTSINQMGGDSNNAARYVNVLAAASQKGAGDIAWLGEAITKSATAAKAVGTDYEELVANLEQLAKAGFDASTAGTALRSIIMNLEKQANNEFKPSVVGLTQAFENLGKANLDIVGYQEIAGKMFASQAMALANASQEAKKMTEAITGTNIAEAQAKTNTDNLDGALKSLASAWEGLNLHINSSNGLLKAFVDWCTNVIRDLDNMTTSAGRAKKALQELNGGDNGQPSKVDRQINALRGSNFKQQKYNSTLGQYDQDIKVAEYYKKKYKEAGWAGGSVLSDITRRFGVNMRGEEDIDNLINNLKTLREDYKRRAEKLLNPTVEADNGKGKGGVVLDVDADTEKATKSIKELQGEIKKLKKLRDDAADSGDNEMRDKYNAQIKDAQAQIKAMRGGNIGTKKNKDDFVEIIGLIGNAQVRVSDLQRQLRESWDQNEITTLDQKLKDAQNELDVLTGKLPKDTMVDITVDVDTAKALQKIGDIEGVTIAPKTVEITATDEALPELVDIEGITITPKTFAITATDEAMPKLREIQGVTIDPKTSVITATDEAMPKLRDIQGVTIEPKTFTITATDEALPKLNKINGITINPKTVTITATDEALPELVDIEGITIAPKTFSITATDEAMPKLREIQGVTIDPKTSVITATDEALPLLREIEGVTVEPKTFDVTATDEAMPKLREIEGVTIEPKNMTVTADTTEALQRVQKLVAEMNGTIIEMKVVPVITDEDIERSLREQYGKPIEVPVVPKTTGEAIEQEIRVKLAEQNMDADMQTLRTLLETQIKNGIEGIEIPSDTLAQAIMGEGINIPNEYWSNLQDQMNEELKKMDIDPINIDFKTGKEKDKKSKGGPMDDTKKVVSGLNHVASGLQQMGIELPEGVNQVLGVVNGLMTIIQGISTIIGVTQFAAITANTVSLDLLTAAIWANTAASVIPFANGGIVGFAKGGQIGKAASGMLIGNHMSGDNLRLPVNGGGYIGVNDGELILNRAQQGVIADALGGGSGLGNLGLSVKVTAEELRFVLGNNSRRRGKGEYVTSTRLR